jgi:hypothetical protein
MGGATPGESAASTASSAPTNTNSPSTATNPPSSADSAKKGSSITALIPAFFGVPLLLAGLIGLNEAYRKHAMHFAALVGLLGCLGAGGRLASKANAWISGDPSVNSRAMWFIVAMTVVCLVYVVLSIKSFVDARKARALAK